MSREEDLVNRRKEAVREHLVSLSAMATETVENLPEVREFLRAQRPAGDKASLSS